MLLNLKSRRLTIDSPTPPPSPRACSLRRWGSRQATGLARRLRDERGAAIIETALTLPILLLVSVGIFEFGRAYETSQVLTNAAREGARVAILPNPGPGAAEAMVRSYLRMGGLQDDASVGVSITNVELSMGAAGTASGSRVVVTYPFTFIVLQPVAQLVVAGSLTGTPITLTAQAEMRNETQF